MNEIFSFMESGCTMKLLSIFLLFVLLFSMAGEAFAFAPQDPGQTVTIGDFGYIDNEGFLWLWEPNGCEEAGVPIGDTSERWIDEPHKVMEDVVASAAEPTRQSC